MPRLAKPYLLRDHYISRAGGEVIKLCHRSEGMTKAKELLRDHLKKRQKEAQQNGGRAVTSLTVSELFVMFLQAVEAEKSEYTFSDYQRWCVREAQYSGPSHRAPGNNFGSSGFLVGEKIR